MSKDPWSGQLNSKGDAVHSYRGGHIADGVRDLLYFIHRQTPPFLTFHDHFSYRGGHIADSVIDLIYLIHRQTPPFLTFHDHFSYRGGHVADSVRDHILYTDKLLYF